MSRYCAFRGRRPAPPCPGTIGGRPDGQPGPANRRVVCLRSAAALAPGPMEASRTNKQIASTTLLASPISLPICPGPCSTPVAPLSAATRCSPKSLRRQWNTLMCFIKLWCLWLWELQKGCEIIFRYAFRNNAFEELGSKTLKTIFCHNTHQINLKKPLLP